MKNLVLTSLPANQSVDMRCDAGRRSVRKSTKARLSAIKFLGKQAYCKGGRFKAVFGYDVADAIKKTTKIS